MFDRDVRSNLPIYKNLLLPYCVKNKRGEKRNYVYGSRSVQFSDVTAFCCGNDAHIREYTNMYCIQQLDWVKFCFTWNTITVKGRFYEQVIAYRYIGWYCLPLNLSEHILAKQFCFTEIFCLRYQSRHFSYLYSKYSASLCMQRGILNAMIQLFAFQAIIILAFNLFLLTFLIIELEVIWCFLIIACENISNVIFFLHARRKKNWLFIWENALKFLRVVWQA